MSDRASGGDDEDEVTIWAGRLRAWPTPPAEEIPDDTVIAQRSAPDDATALTRRRSAPVEEPDDATALTRRRSTPVDAPDEATALSNRRAAPDDATALTRRRPTPVAEPDDATALSSRSAALGDATALTHRRETSADAPGVDAPAAAPEDHTVARIAPVTRRSAVIDDRTESGRPVRVPDADAREIYRPRAGEPAIAARVAPAARAAQEPVDVAAAATAAGRRRRRRVATFVAVGSAAILLAAAGAVAIAVMPV